MANKRKTKAIDIILSSKNQTITKSELSVKMNLAAGTTEDHLRHLRDKDQVVTVATQEDTIIYGKEYAEANGIQTLARREFNKTSPINPFTKRPYKKPPEPKPKALNINDFWVMPSHRVAQC